MCRPTPWVTHLSKLLSIPNANENNSVSCHRYIPPCLPVRYYTDHILDISLYIFSFFFSSKLWSITEIAMGQWCGLVVVMFMLLSSLACIIVALLTDNWYKVSTEDNINPDIKKANNFHYGQWRLCYDEMPTGIWKNNIIWRSHYKQNKCYRWAGK